MSSRGQSFVELAVAAPALVLLAFGCVTAVRVADAATGLDAAVHQAAEAAAAAPDPAVATTEAERCYQAVLATYPVHAGRLSLDLAGFARGGRALAAADGWVDVGWVPNVPGGRIELHASAAAEIEPWRTRTQ